MPTSEGRQAYEMIAGRRLCVQCLDALRKELTRLPALYRDCERTLVSRRQRSLERVRGGRPNGIHLNEDVVSTRSDIIAVLASWVAMVAEERGATPPKHRHVTKLVAFLVRHLDWLTSHPAIGDFSSEIADLAEAAEGVVDPSSAFRMSLGPCGEPGCDRAVHATMRADAKATAYQVRCEAGHEWQPHQWLSLGRRMEHSERAASRGHLQPMRDEA